MVVSNFLVLLVSLKLKFIVVVASFITIIYSSLSYDWRRGLALLLLLLLTIAYYYYYHYYFHLLSSYYYLLYYLTLGFRQ